MSHWRSYFLHRSLNCFSLLSLCCIWKEGSALLLPLRLPAHRESFVSGSTHLMKWSDSLLDDTQLGLNFCPFHPSIAHQWRFNILHSWDWSVAVKIRILSRARGETEVGIFTQINAYTYVMLIQAICVILFCPFKDAPLNQLNIRQRKTLRLLRFLKKKKKERAKTSQFEKSHFSCRGGNFYTECHNPESGDVHLNS